MPVIDEIAADYRDEVRFIAVAGRAGEDKTRARAAELLHNVEWGLDESIWDLYGIPGQPASVLVTGTDVVVDGWFGAVGEEHLRAALDSLVALGA